MLCLLYYTKGDRYEINTSNEKCVLAFNGYFRSWLDRFLRPRNIQYRNLGCTRWQCPALAERCSQRVLIIPVIINKIPVKFSRGFYFSVLVLLPEKPSALRQHRPFVLFDFHGHFFAKEKSR